MSEIVETITRVAAFAEPKDAMHQAMTDVHFRKGEVFAQSLTGGSIEPVELDLNCGVNARVLLKALKAVSKDPGFEVDGSHFIIHSGRSKAKLETSSAATAPKFHRPAKKAAWLPVPLLHEAYRLAWGVSQDTTRQHLCGIALTKAGIGVTNGHIAMKLGSEDYHKLFGIKADLILPAPVLKNLPSPTFAAMDASGQRMFFGDAPNPSAFRSANLFDSHFPPLDQVMDGPRKHPRMVVDRKELLDMIKRAKLSSQNATLRVASGRLSVEIEASPEMTLFSFADSISFEPSGKGTVADGLVRLNLGYILQVVETATSDAVQIGMAPTKGGSINPVYLIDGILEAVLMPMRI